MKTIGVIGAGQMGAGIAQVSAMAGYKCQLWDANRPALEKGFEGIKSQLKKMVEKEKITAAQQMQTIENLGVAKSLSDFSSCDLVVEAIIENLDIKLKVFAELDAILR